MLRIIYISSAIALILINLIACSGGGGDSGSPAVSVDTTPPSIPSGVSSGTVTSTRVSLSWAASTDNSGSVAGYKIYRNGTYLTSVATTAFTDTNLAYNTVYRYQISSYDSSNNESARSSEIQVTTAPSFSKQFGTAANDVSNAISIDGNGNIYIAGYTAGNLDGQLNSGSDDIFLVKYNSAGIKQWTKLLGTAVNESAKGIAIDSSNNVYIAGWTTGNLDGQINSGSSDAFIIKYDSTGNKLWTKLFGSASSDFCQGIAIDSSGYIYIAGDTGGDLDGQINSGNRDAFVSKFDSNGNVQWTRLLGTATIDDVWGIASDSSGIYITGQTTGNLDGIINAGGTDIYIAKYDFSGILQWTKLAGTAAEERGRAITTDNSGNVYITGETYGDLDGQVNSGGADIFVIKFDSSGTKQWTRLLGTGNDDVGVCITSDTHGSIYVSGRTMGDLDGNTNSGNLDIFLSKYDASGTKSWTKTIGTTADDYAHGIVAKEDFVYMTGVTDGNLDGNVNAGAHDIFILQYDLNGSKQ